MALENFMTPEFAEEFFAKEKEMDVYVTLKVTMVQTQDIEGVMENTHMRLAHPDIRGYEVVSASKVNALINLVIHNEPLQTHQAGRCGQRR